MHLCVIVHAKSFTMAKTAKPNPFNDPEMKALLDKLKEADKWLPANANELTAQKLGMHLQSVRMIRWGNTPKGSTTVRWNVDVVLFLLELAAEQKKRAENMLKIDFS